MRILLVDDHEIVRKGLRVAARRRARSRGGGRGRHRRRSPSPGRLRLSRRGRPGCSSSRRIRGRGMPGHPLGLPRRQGADADLVRRRGGADVGHPGRGIRLPSEADRLGCPARQPAADRSGRVLDRPGDGGQALLGSARRRPLLRSFARQALRPGAQSPRSDHRGA